MTRAALLPAGSDPFVLRYWLRNFATWSQYVDELHVVVCGWLEAEALDYIKALIAAVPKATLYHVTHRADHGKMIAYLLRKTKADHIMLCEDDAYVRRPEVVAECFRFAEEGGIAGTWRDGYASQEVIGVATKELGRGYAYWPCFLFVAREHLLATDRWFSGRVWERGESLMGHQLNQQNTSDTMISLSWQLRAMRLPERLMENHRMSGQVLPDDAPWFHIGSLSSGHGQLWQSEKSDAVPYDAEIAQFRRLPSGEALKRVAWWWRVWRTAVGEIPKYREQYRAGLAKVMYDLDIAQHNIDWYHSNLGDLAVTWAER